MELDAARVRLREWGYWMRQAPDLPGELGWPSQAVGAEAMQRPIDRRKDEQAYADAMARAARRGKVRLAARRTVGADGVARTVIVSERVLHMVPMAQPADTRGWKPASGWEPWPESAREIHQLVAMLSRDEQQVVHCCYWLQLGRRLAPQRLEISERRYWELKIAAEASIRGMLLAKSA